MNSTWRLTNVSIIGEHEPDRGVHLQHAWSLWWVWSRYSLVVVTLKRHQQNALRRCGEKLHKLSRVFDSKSFKSSHVILFLTGIDRRASIIWSEKTKHLRNSTDPMCSNHLPGRAPRPRIKRQDKPFTFITVLVSSCSMPSPSQDWEKMKESKNVTSSPCYPYHALQFPCDQISSSTLYHLASHFASGTTKTQCQRVRVPRSQRCRDKSCPPMVPTAALLLALKRPRLQIAHGSLARFCFGQSSHRKTN